MSCNRELYSADLLFTYTILLFGILMELTQAWQYSVMDCSSTDIDTIPIVIGLISIQPLVFLTC